MFATNVGTTLFHIELPNFRLMLAVTDAAAVLD